MTSNTNGRRRKRNIVSIAYNLLAWCLDVLGDLLGLMVRSWDYHLAMVLVGIISCGLTPVIYLIGGQDYYSRATSSGEKNFAQHIVHLVRGQEIIDKPDSKSPVQSPMSKPSPIQNP